MSKFSSHRANKLQHRSLSQALCWWLPTLACWGSLLGLPTSQAYATTSSTTSVPSQNYADQSKTVNAVSNSAAVAATNAAATAANTADAVANQVGEAFTEQTQVGVEEKKTLEQLFDTTNVHTVYRNDLQITYGKDFTQFMLDPSTIPHVTINSEVNAFTVFRYYLIANKVRHLNMPDAYPETYKYTQEVYKALLACESVFPQGSDELKDGSIVAYQGNILSVEQAHTKLDNYNRGYNKHYVTQFKAYLTHPCVQQALAQAASIDEAKFITEQLRNPNFIDTLQNGYRRLFTTYYSRPENYFQTPPLVFTNQLADNGEVTVIAQAMEQYEKSSKAKLIRNNSKQETDYQRFLDYAQVDQKAIMTVTNGKVFTTKVRGLGSNDFVAAQGGTSIYAQVGQNVANAIQTINEVNADGSLRHRFTVYKVVNNALLGKGFYNAKVNVQQVSDKEFFVTIDPGKPVLVIDKSQIQVKGQGSGESTLYSNFPAKVTAPGNVLNFGDYNAVKGNLSSGAEEEGYLDAYFENSQILINPHNNTAYWNLTFNTGQRYRIGKIVVQGGPVDHRLVYHMTQLTPLEPYSQTDLALSITRLQSTKNFDSIDVQTFVDNESKTVDLLYTLEAAKQNNLEASLGYDTLERVRTKLNYERLYVNRWGGSINSYLYLSNLNQRFTFNYKHPYIYSPIDKFFNVGVTVAREYQSQLLYYSRSVVGYLNYSRLPVSNWQLSSSLYVRKDLWQELGTKYNQNLAYSDFTLARSGLTTDVSLTLRSTFGLDWFLKKNPKFTSLTFKASHIFQLSEKNALQLGVRLGKITSSNFRNLAPSLRFYSGGANSLRGYGYQSISSYKGMNDIGSNSQAEFTAEYLRTIANNLQLAFFVDGGNSSDHIKFDNLYYGGGFGVRYNLPVGYAKFDIAYPFQKGFSWSKIFFYLGIYASF